MLFFAGLVASATALSPSVVRLRSDLRLRSSATLEECASLEAEDLKWGVCLNPSLNRYEFNCLDVEYSIDEVFARLVKAPGLGIELTEVANNGDIGIVLVSGIVPGSPASESNLAPGDVLASVNGRNVEAMSYDDLVDVLIDAGSIVDIVAKRLLKRFKVGLALDRGDGIEAPGADGLFAGENLRRGLAARGVKVNDATLGPNCGGDGSCTTCAVDVVEGGDLLTEITAPEKVIFKNTPTWRLACQASVRELDPDDPRAKTSTLKLKVYPHRAG